MENANDEQIRNPSPAGSENGRQGGHANDEQIRNPSPAGSENGRQGGHANPEGGVPEGGLQELGAVLREDKTCDKWCLMLTGVGLLAGNVLAVSLTDYSKPLVIGSVYSALAVLDTAAVGFLWCYIRNRQKKRKITADPGTAMQAFEEGNAEENPQLREPAEPRVAFRREDRELQ